MVCCRRPRAHRLVQDLEIDPVIENRPLSKLILDQVCYCTAVEGLLVLVRAIVRIRQPWTVARVGAPGASGQAEPGDG